MTPEARHLLAALHAPAGRDDYLLSHLTDDAWDRMAALALRQRLGPLLHSRAPLQMPERSRARLKRRLTWSARRSLLLNASLRELAERGLERDIPVVALKGMHLALAYYDNPAHREMGDIDVLVPRPGAALLQQDALALGYRPYSGTSVDVALAVSHHLPLLIRHGIGLEVHVGLHAPATSPPIDVDNLLKRATPLPGGGAALALSPEDLLLHLCLHATHNHALAAGLRPLVDLQIVMERSGAGLDWDYVESLATTWGCSRSVHLLLTLAHRHLGSPMPQAWRRDHPGVIPDAIAEAAMQFITEDALHMGDAGREAQLMVGMSGWRRKWQQLVARVDLDPLELAALYPHAERSAAHRMVARFQRLTDVTRRNAWWYLRVSARRAPAFREAIERRNQLTAWLNS
jgi:hypothetical protein